MTCGDHKISAFPKLRDFDMLCATSKALLRQKIAIKQQYNCPSSYWQTKGEIFENDHYGYCIEMRYYA